MPSNHMAEEKKEGFLGKLLRKLDGKLEKESKKCCCCKEKSK